VSSVSFPLFANNKLFLQYFLVGVHNLNTSPDTSLFESNYGNMFPLQPPHDVPESTPFKFIGVFNPRDGGSAAFLSGNYPFGATLMVLLFFVLKVTRMRPPFLPLLPLKFYLTPLLGYYNLWLFSILLGREFRCKFRKVFPPAQVFFFSPFLRDLSSSDFFPPQRRPKPFPNLFCPIPLSTVIPHVRPASKQNAF